MGVEGFEFIDVGEVIGALFEDDCGFGVEVVFNYFIPDVAFDLSFLEREERVLIDV